MINSEFSSCPTISISHILSDSTINHFLKYYGHTAICLFLILSWCLLKYLFKSLLYHGTNWLTIIKLWNTNLLSRSNMNGFRIIWFGSCSEKTHGMDFVYIFTHQMSVTATACDLRTTKPYSYLHSDQFHRPIAVLSPPPDLIYMVSVNHKVTVCLQLATIHNMPGNAYELTQTVHSLKTLSQIKQLQYKQY